MALEYLLRTNEYKKPHVLSGRDAIATKLVILLNMKPGTDPMHPEMGVDMPGRYRFCGQDDIDDLQEEINNQIETYFPIDISLSTNVKVVWDNSVIRAHITVDNTVYPFSTSDDGTMSLDDVLGNTEPPDDEDIEDDIPEPDDYWDNAPTYPGDAGDIGY
jgi:hypothetical protein